MNKITIDKKVLEERVESTIQENIDELEQGTYYKAIKCLYFMFCGHLFTFYVNNLLLDSAESIHHDGATSTVRLTRSILNLVILAANLCFSVRIVYVIFTNKLFPSWMLFWSAQYFSLFLYSLLGLIDIYQATEADQVDQPISNMTQVNYAVCSVKFSKPLSLQTAQQLVFLLFDLLGFSCNFLLSQKLLKLKNFRSYKTNCLNLQARKTC